MNQKIHLTGDFRQIEFPADTTIKPGMILEQNATDELAPHSASANGVATEVIVAQEDALRGKTVADSYAADDPVTAYIPQRGSLSQLLFKAGYNYTKTTKVISAGDGTVMPQGTNSGQVFGVVITAVDLSASGAVDTLGKARLL